MHGNGCAWHRAADSRRRRWARPCARVTTFDLSDVHLEKHRAVAERAEWADSSVSADTSLDVVRHPVANVFEPDVDVVWPQCARVLRPG